ncbi:MAG: aminomethyl-transferring glycine dehydrogenase, partial [Planctomycetota bacterium]
MQGEHAVLEVIRGIASRNKVFRSCIGMGYHGTIVPGVIQRNILENPGWYTQYTPYQAEISQGRLEALLNFQTMVSELTGMEVASASLLDEATAAAEALTMALNIAADRPRRVFVSDKCHPQTIGVVSTRSAMMDVECVVGDPATADLEVGGGYAGVLLQYPETNGSVERVPACVTRAKASGAIVICAADLLALTLLESPGALGADIAVGSTQRFGVPMGYGGPHAAYLATGERHVRRMPGRIVGVSKDADGKPALRLALQTREQHIKRDRATSNICTAQVLLAVMAGMYAVYHGPEGLRRIARRVNGWTRVLAKAITDAGHRLYRDDFFDMICVEAGSDADRIVAAAERKRINLRSGRRTGGDEDCVGVSLDETVTRGLVEEIAQCFGGTLGDASDAELLAEADASRGDSLPLAMRRGADYMLQPVFNTMESESELLRYIFKLQSRDLSLAHSMIPLGSCTMKLNATSEMVPVSWAEFGGLHPYAPPEQAAGYHELIVQLKRWLCEITGFEACSMQPNSGAQGEYAGLLAIKRYHEARGEGRRRVCIVPESAHGTNPASAVMAGMKVVPVKNRSDGGIDYDDLRAKVEHHADELSALMVTYPSTCGVFDANIRDICALVHEHGGQVYMDGANMNAQVGLCRPGDIGADVCHLNLHKTFCIPHGGGGPGMGPIGVAGHLSDFLPGDPQHRGTAAVSAAPFGSPSILPISWMYIAMMGAAGLRRASEV